MVLYTNLLVHYNLHSYAYTHYILYYTYTRYHLYNIHIYTIRYTTLYILYLIYTIMFYTILDYTIFISTIYTLYTIPYATLYYIDMLRARAAEETKRAAEKASIMRDIQLTKLKQELYELNILYEKEQVLRYICMYVCVCVCMYVCSIYISVCIHACMLVKVHCRCVTEYPSVVCSIYVLVKYILYSYILCPTYTIHMYSTPIPYYTYILCIQERGGNQIISGGN